MKFKFKFQLQIDIKQNELESIEMELLDVKNKIETNLFLQEENEKNQNNIKTNFRFLSYSWQFKSSTDMLQTLEMEANKLKKEYNLLKRDKDIIIHRYSSKKAEIKMFEKIKEKEYKKFKTSQKLKEEKKLSEMTQNTGDFYDSK